MDHKIKGMHQEEEEEGDRKMDRWRVEADLLRLECNHACLWPFVVMAGTVEDYPLYYQTTYQLGSRTVIATCQNCSLRIISQDLSDFVAGMSTENRHWHYEDREGVMTAGNFSSIENIWGLHPASLLRPVLSCHQQWKTLFIKLPIFPPEIHRIIFFEFLNLCDSQKHPFLECALFVLHTHLVSFDTIDIVPNARDKPPNGSKLLKTNPYETEK